MKNLIFWLMLGIMFLTACTPDVREAAPPPPASDAPVSEKYYCTVPGSDNGLSWKSGAQICYDTQVYTLSVTVVEGLASNQTLQGRFSGYGNGYSSGRMWTEGKGISLVRINSMNPPPDTSWGAWLDMTKPYILKTTDLGFMGVPVGGTVIVICKHDVEALSPSFSGQTFTDEYVTHELDNCRLQTKNVDVPLAE